ncbi:PREDICTED: uncharacterized protein LOC104717996 [Camelina sativa]|uniref:Uncharacterized protein LOC104717996 n=1 Tax=Camelina sativa TaxID=90675 RepID=A0ABM0U079_CAMSA|nr:PREDICTED: uncharacterized protein LOC104717996 [Camelina sativa]
MKMKLGCPLPVMWMTFLCYILCCSILMSQGHRHDIVEAAEKIKSFEDFEIEQKLKHINKPAVKIIKSISGQRYGCVDFYKQPGFDQSSMKNHTFHYKMGMISHPKGSKVKRETVLRNKTFGHLWENGVGCPIGTVPTYRVTKDDLLRMKSFDDENSNPQSSWKSAYQPTLSNEGHHYFSVVRTKGKPRIYNGASMNMHRGTCLAGPMQFSSGRMTFQIGNEFIQVGRISHPQLYKDAWIRLFVFTNAGGHPCFNNFCPDGSGMILVSHDFAPGLLLHERDYDIAIQKDKANGNWWLLMGPSWQEIGFWPASRFKESHGTGIEWGGEVYSPSLPSPPMGNGGLRLTPEEDAYMRLITIVDENYNTDKRVGNTEAFSNNKFCYPVLDVKDSFWKHVGHFVLYGGRACNKL